MVIRKLRSKSSGKTFYDAVSSDDTHTIYNSGELDKITTFRIGEWYSGISDLYEPVQIQQAEMDYVLLNIKN